MALNRIEPPTADLFSLDEAKAHLRVTSTNATLEAYIARLMIAAREAAETALRRTLLTTTWRLTLDHGFPCEIRLAMPPVTEVLSIKYTDTDGVEQTLDPSIYQVALAQEPGRIVPAYGQVWPSTRCELEAVRVEFTAGYGDAEDVPERTRQWALLALTDMYENRAASNAQPVVRQEFVDRLLDGEVIWEP